MSATVAAGISTREKLLRAKRASARTAQLAAEQKEAILLAMADAIEKNAADILRANAA